MALAREFPSFLLIPLLSYILPLLNVWFKRIANISAEQAHCQEWVCVGCLSIASIPVANMKHQGTEHGGGELPEP